MTTVNRSPIKFFILLYALSIPLWIAELLIEVPGLPLQIPVTDLLAAFTPMITACILIFREQGRKEVVELLKRSVQVKLHSKAGYLPILLLAPVLFTLIFSLISLLGLPVSNQIGTSLLTMTILLIFFFLGALGEEVGYMGYAFGPMQQRFGTVKASVLIGIPWAVWHYPSILQQGHGLSFILWGTLGTIAMRVLIVWLYNITGQNLFACILFHALYNTGRAIFPHTETIHPLVDYPAIHYSVIALVALAIIVISKMLSGRNRPANHFNFNVLNL